VRKGKDGHKWDGKLGGGLSTSLESPYCGVGRPRPGRRNPAPKCKLILLYLWLTMRQGKPINRI
jgi:hypothetical protein